MANRGVLESVKVARYGVTVNQADTDVYTEHLPVNPGPDEVIVLLGHRVVLLPAAVTGFLLGSYLIWRKTDIEWPEAAISMAGAALSDDVISGGSMCVSGHDGVNTNFGTWWFNDDVIYPYPVVLTRPPQVVYQAYVNEIGFDFGVLMYYLTERVSREELTRLMVKDHA